MTRLIFVLLLAVVCPTFAAAQQDELPYNYVKLEEKISIAPTDATRGRISLKGGVELLDYREVHYNDEYAMLTLAGRKPVVAALLLYTSGTVYVVNPGLLLPTDHSTTLSAQLPVDTPSLLRLLIFDRHPDRRIVAGFAARPASATSKYLLADQWLRIFGEPTRRRDALMPWEENFEFFARLTGARSRWPYALARLDSTLRVRAKDCHVRYSGLTTVEIGEYGPVGAWPVEIAESLRFSFNVPQRALYKRGIMVVVADPAGAQFEVVVNGFRVPVLPDPEGSPVMPGVDIRSYLQSGANEVELRAPTFGQGGRIQRVELWLE